MSTNLKGKKVAILASNGFEESELTGPRQHLEAAGAQTEILSLKTGPIKGWNHTDWGKSVNADRAVKDASPADYDALVLPGGQMNPDNLRVDKDAVAFIRDFAESGKPVAAICHGPWTLIEAGVVNGRTMTSWPSLKTDLRNAGADWVDKEVVQDGNIITSRKPDDIAAFSKKLIEAIGSEGHATRAA
ncbi:MAG TPA: type 1 glutamine amidotransferase domain-containing protein [Acidobacteriaceae bacterium]